MPPDATFIPSATIPEATTRMFALTGAPPAGTRGPKRALVALATSLGLDVDLAAVNAVLGRQVAEALGVGWSQPRDYRDLQVTLAGLNRLLRAATSNLARLAGQASVASSSQAATVLAAFPGFRPAWNKQEAVNRLCDLAGVPHDTLGPGGKEHAWTLRDVARRLAPNVLVPMLTKHQLAKALCEEFGVPWLDTAGSTGASISLVGLNLILAGAERRAKVFSGTGWQTAEQEGRALVDILGERLPPHWDGRAAVQEMRQSGSTQWRQTEWAGFYFEEKVREILNEVYPTPALGGPRRRFGATVFDYATATRVWDAKAHTARRVDLPGGRPYVSAKDSVTWLNDARAMRECVGLQGLGFLVLEGESGLDTTGAFKEWHRAFGMSTGRAPRPYTASTGNRRARKARFTPMELRAIWIQDEADLLASIAGGWLRQAAQPDWGGTARRADKFKARFAAASRWQVAGHEWPAVDPERAPSSSDLLASAAEEDYDPGLLF